MHSFYAAISVPANVRVRWWCGPPGGVGDRHLATVPQGVVGDRLPSVGNDKGGGYVAGTEQLILLKSVSQVHAGRGKKCKCIFFAFFCISRSQWFFAYFAFFCICFAFSFFLLPQSMDKFVSRGVFRVRGMQTHLLCMTVS